MERIRDFCVRSLAICAAAIALSAGFGVIPARCGERTLYSFQGGSDGNGPYGGLIADAAGNFYGTTNVGGVGHGTVFKLARDGKERVLHAFAGSDGYDPYAGLIADSSGNLFGTASEGGANNYGTVFMIAPDGTETTLYAFQGGSDGVDPYAGLIADQNGDFFGTTAGGGSYNGSACKNGGCGTVFELKPDGTKILLYTFLGGSDGSAPLGSLIEDSSGDLLGTTSDGGTVCESESIGCGTVFKVAPDGTETQLHIFQGGSDGYQPYAGLIANSAGNLYGTTLGGGSGGANCPAGQSGCGTIFKLAPDGTETILYSFQGGSDGFRPESSLIMDNAGNLYGTTLAGGGIGGCKQGGGFGCGTVFKLAPDGTETVLYAFKGGNKGRLRGNLPAAALLLENGVLYGTATAGGTKNDGVVFRVKN